MRGAGARLIGVNLAWWTAAAVIDWSLIVAAICLLSYGWHWLPVSIAIIGNRQHALGILMHEAAHGNISRMRWLNDWAARLVTAWPLGVQLEPYRDFHLWHHARLNLVDDPEIRFKIQHPIYFAPRKWYRIGFDFVGDLLFQSIGEIRTFYRLMGSNNELLAVAFFWLQVTVACVYLGAWWIVPLWWLSFLSVGWAHNRLRIWLEHSGSPDVATWRIRLPWPLEWLFRPHNVGYHWEHHRAPKVAWWRLRAGGR